MAEVKKFFSGLFTKIAYDALSYQLGICLAGISGVLTHIYATNNKYLVPYAIILSFSAAFGIAFFCVYMYKARSPFYKVYLKTDFNYLILSRSCTYRYKDYTQMQYTKRLTLKVLGDNIDRYYDKYNWTGFGNVTITSSNKEHTIMMGDKKDAFQQFVVEFGRWYKKGEIINLCLTYDCVDLEHKADSVLSNTVVEPTNNLKLKVILPKSFGVTKASIATFPLIDSRQPIENGVLEFNDNNVDDSTTEAIEWEVKKPYMLLVYSIKWDMSKK